MNIKKEHIIKIFFHGLDPRKFSSNDVSKQIEEITAIISAWESNKHKIEKL